ncbi:protein phosphatase 1 regulatory subunit 1A isoform X2 [Ambystoma mexicanum]|uniref:protein phosphatase 1 regulatory subunit 1A isoform X2 n=1 Tax=Ambystoma mexicanum TaxID=8296 RepID=UPI0037E9942A
MDPNSPRKIQFTVPLLEPYLDPEAAEQIRRRRPTPATLVLTSDQSSPELQLLAEHHLCRQQQEAEGGGSVDHQDSLPETHTPGCCHHGSTDPSQAPGEAEPCGCLRNDSAEVETRLSSQESVHSDGSEGGKSGGATEHQAEDLSSDMQKIHIPQQDSTPDRSAGD